MDTNVTRTTQKLINKMAKTGRIKEQIKQKAKKSKEERLEALYKQEFLTIRSALGNQWANWFCIIGGRMAGKTWSAQNYALQTFFTLGHQLYHVPFVWMRLNDKACDNMTQCNCMGMFEPTLMEKFHITGLKYKGNVLWCKDPATGKDIHLCDIYGLSTAYNNKGKAMFDVTNFRGKNIFMDEIAYEKNQKKTFDVAYGVSLQIENLTRDKRHRVKVIMMLNQTEDCPDVIATIFDYVPLEFGIYKLARHKKDIIRLDKLMDSPDKKVRKEAEREYMDLAVKEHGKYFGVRGVIYNMPLTDKANKRNAVRLSAQADPNGENFTNKIKKDLSLLWRKRLTRPSYIIKFSKDETDWFTVWDDKVVANYRGEKIHRVKAMNAFCGDAQIFIPEDKQFVYDSFKYRNFMYFNYKTLKLFEHRVSEITGVVK